MAFRCLLLAAALIGAPLGAKPVPRAAIAAKANPAALEQACDRLAVALTPGSSVPLQVDTAVSAMLQAMVQQDASFAAMNQKYTGLTDAIPARVRPLMIGNSKATLPLYRADLSQLYCGAYQSFSPRLPGAS